jgi:hypothetical protein
MNRPLPPTIQCRLSTVSPFISRHSSLFFVVWVFLLPAWGAAEHNALLPRPQQVRYGSRLFPVRGLSIHLPDAPAAEDRFAAEELAAFLSDRATAPILVSESRASERVIVLKRTGPVDALPVPGERTGAESREAYGLKVTPGGAEIEARSSAGLFYAVETLCQLVEGRAGEAVLPEVEIHDWPDLAYRGVMVDMSHGPLPTEEEVKRQIDFLARWKENQYYFYSEASIEFDGYPLLNPQGRFTQDQVRRIIDYARQRHIDVVPCLELYGHLHDLFQVERYSDLAAVPHGSEFNPNKPQVLTLLTDWVGQMARLFPSPFMHVGMDETWELEKFAKSEAGGITPGKLYLKHFKNVAGLVNLHGKRVMVWGDIFRKYPEIIPELPAGTVVVPWEYGPTSDYKPFLAPFISTHVPQVIATGVTIWNQIAPDFDLSFDNIDTFLATGRQFGILGNINTIWSDDAQVLMRSAFPGMAYGAAAAWQSAPMARAEFFSEYAHLVYPALVAREVVPALRDLAESETRLQNTLGRDTMHAFWADPLTRRSLKASETHRDDLKQARLLAEDAQERLGRALSLGGDPVTLSSLLLQARLLDYAAMKNIYAAEIDDFWRGLGPNPKADDLDFLLFSEISAQNHSRIEDLMDRITELREAYRAAWLAGYTPYRLGTALGKWEAEFQYWWNLQRRFRRFTENFHNGDALPPLESFTQEH